MGNRRLGWLAAVVALIATACQVNLEGAAPVGQRQVVSGWTVDGCLARWEGGAWHDTARLSGDGAWALFVIGHPDSSDCAYEPDSSGIVLRSLDSGQEQILEGNLISASVRHLSVDGSTALWEARPPGQPEFSLRWWRTGSTRRSIAGTFLSADDTGDRVLVQDSETGEVRLWRADEGRSTGIGDLPGLGDLESVETIRLSGNGRYLVASWPDWRDYRRRGGLYLRYDLETEQYIEFENRPCEEGCDDAAPATGLHSVSSDGRYLFTSSWYRYDIETGVWLFGNCCSGDPGLFWVYDTNFFFSGDGSTVVSPQYDPAGDSIPTGLVFDADTFSSVRLPLIGREDVLGMSHDGQRFLVADDPDDGSYVLRVLELPR